MAVFHGLSALAIAIFLAGALSRARFWLSDDRSPGDGGRRPTKRLAQQASVAIRFLLRPQTLQTLFWNGLVMRQVWRESRLRWLIHLTISWSFVGLFAVGSLGNYAADFGAPLEKDDAWFAAFNDAAALALLAGLGLALGRRYLTPAAHTRTIFDDAIVLVLLALLGLSGLLVEAGRILEEGTTASAGGYAFLGYPLSQALEPLDWNWEVAAGWVWWTHAVASLSFVAYLPYSKLRHMFTSPITIALASDKEAPSPENERSANQETEPWPA